MAKKNTRSPSKQAACKRYKDNMTWEKNRLAKLERHIKKHPEDKEAQRALNNISYRRQKPQHRGINTDNRPIQLNGVSIVPIVLIPYSAYAKQS